MFLTRACPRCCGDLYQDRDLDGYHLICLQCGQEIQLTRKLASGERVTPDLLDRVRVAVTTELAPQRTIREDVEVIARS